MYKVTYKDLGNGRIVETTCSDLESVYNLQDESGIEVITYSWID